MRSERTACSSRTYVLAEGPARPYRGAGGNNTHFELVVPARDWRVIVRSGWLWISLGDYFLRHWQVHAHLMNISMLALWTIPGFWLGFLVYGRNVRFRAVLCLAKYLETVHGIDHIDGRHCPAIGVSRLFSACEHASAMWLSSGHATTQPDAVCCMPCKCDITLASHVAGAASVCLVG